MIRNLVFMSLAVVFSAPTFGDEPVPATSPAPPSCGDRCSAARETCLGLLNHGTRKISSPYLLENLTPEQLAGIKSSKFMTSGRAAVADSFSEWDISTDPQTGRLVLTPENPVLTGTVVVVPKKQKKHCESVYQTCADVCLGL